MDRQRVRNSLEALKLEIQLLDGEREVMREQLIKLASRMEKIIDGADQDDYTRIKDGVMETIETYEIEHPRLTSITNDIMQKLMSMGI